MVFALFRKDRSSEGVVHRLYGAIVAQARDPAFFRDQGVPDTLDGRFDCMVLHVFLLLHRLKEESEDKRALGQAVFDLFFLDMDRGLRELGVGPDGVPKRIRAMGEAFYGRVKVYDEALASAEPDALERALARNLVGREEADASALAGYVRAAAAGLSALPYEALARGEAAFPPAPRLAGGAS